MPKSFEPQIVTANDLLLGDVVYFTDTGGWSREHGDAAVAATQEAADALLKSAAADHLIVVGPYLAGARSSADGRPEPTHFREAIRTKGPTFRSDLGKQADSALADKETA